MYPETARRSLEEIDMMFDSNVKAWQSHKVHDKFSEEIEKHRQQSVAEAEKPVDIPVHAEVV